jgi:hypothetical protein
MSVDFSFRRNAVKSLTSAKGVYVLADLDNTPIYVGQSRDGIRQRVQRHLTSARSDVIANRQIDVWEIAYVWEYPAATNEAIDELEAALVHEFNPLSSLMNGTIPNKSRKKISIPKPTKIVQVMSDKEIQERKDPEQRLPRQASHYAQLVGHFLAVKNSDEIARAMDAHFQRLQKYHQRMLKSAQDLGDE